MKLTADQIERVRKMRFQYGHTWDRIGELFDCTGETVRRAVDPEFRAKRNQGIREARQQRRDWAGGDLLRVQPKYRPDPCVIAERDSRADYIQTPNMAVLGDPPPGRSALDQMRGTDG